MAFSSIEFSNCRLFKTYFPEVAPTDRRVRGYVWVLPNGFVQIDFGYNSRIIGVIIICVDSMKGFDIQFGKMRQRDEDEV